MNKYQIHIDTGDFDTVLYPVPPQTFMSCSAACVHTPCPSGYLQWHEFAEMSSKTHSPIRCPRCGLWSIWLPKLIAKAINRKYDREEKAFLEQHRKAHLRSEIARMTRELKSVE